MQRRDVLRAGALAGSVGIAGCTGGSGPSEFKEGFENGMGDWEADKAIGPEVDVDEFEQRVRVSSAEAYEGSQSLELWNEGDYDDGVTWVTHPVEIQSGRAYDVTVSVEFWSESESFNTLRDAVVRLGPEKAEVEEDFPHPGVNTTQLGETPYGGLREPLWLADGWKEYRFEWTTPTLEVDTLHLAFGHAVIWEGDATHYVDDVSVEFEGR